MADGINLCVVGAGSSYTPELIETIINLRDDELPVATIRLMDIDAERLRLMTGLTERMLRHAGKRITVESSVDLQSLLPGVDFVITQIRVGGMKARYLDESIPLKYGIIGQETTGPGGMCKALRTIPPMLAIARMVYELAPQAFILNYTNPSGIITEAVRKYANPRLIGLCAGIPSIQGTLADWLRERYPDITTSVAGLNHLGFVHQFTSGGCDVTHEAIDWLSSPERLAAQPDTIGTLPEARLLQAIPISYLYYYLHRQRRVEEARNVPRTRAQAIEELEAAVFADAADPQIVTKPQALAKRGGGGYASITFRVLNAIYRNTGEQMTVNVPNQGALEGIDADAVVEVMSRIDRTGATPLPVGPIPLAFRGLVHSVKAYETLTVEAAIYRSKRLVTLALLNHPLVGDLDVIAPLLDEMLAAHGLSYT